MRYFGQKDLRWKVRLKLLVIDNRLQHRVIPRRSMDIQVCLLFVIMDFLWKIPKEKQWRDGRYWEFVNVFVQVTVQWIFRLLQMSNNKESEQYRIEGNEHFRANRFHNALNCYTKSLECKETATVLSNRAQTYLNLNEYAICLFAFFTLQTPTSGMESVGCSTIYTLFYSKSFLRHRWQSAL